jgi:hypothetical protein
MFHHVQQLQLPAGLGLRTATAILSIMALYAHLSPESA